MPKPRRNVDAVVEATLSPPDTLGPHEQLASVKQGAGNHLYHLRLSDGTDILAELPAKFRSTVWLRRGSFVLVDTTALADRDNKLGGVIVNFVGDYKVWRKMPYWPAGLEKKVFQDADESEDDGPKMPPSDDEED